MSVIKHVGLFLVPISVSAIAVAWHLDLLTPETQAVPPEVVVAEVVQPFEVLDYPESTDLAQLPREWPSAELSRDIGTFLQPSEYANEGEAPDLTTATPVTSTASTHRRDDLGLSLDDLDLSSLSPDLAKKVENALSQNDAPTSAPSQVNDLERNAQQWQGRLPALNLQTHMYASDANRRWVKINNVEYHQGDVVDGQVTLKEIQPQAVIVEFQGEQIRIPALYEWDG
ncbi:TPA: general secretion pathway protein GspB [Vibrio parahaemolyticus]|uniref:general secretion pathway protein GspB n=1 Tax=Vibrio parahaemolyticus TaxID=670 RepID=UPI001123288A|nr:general secretion pathway protein GspB [Vibrio parahaemolyticus]MDF4498052.1 general secretion pathway protein GspB [Vibrio parahaemolyticus]MDG3378147.1 general secretion pathway protein GspB [Vibrio parahaemolyticus]TOA63640.1 general secretion pathway protein GspB [Vibrio parahaemolyticus]